jgi:Ca-activated chloride channel family protein
MDKLPRLTRTRRIALAGLLMGIAVALGRLLAVSEQALSANGVGRWLLDSGRAHDAMIVFEDSKWRGVALYRAGRYQRAIAEFAQDAGLDSLYNIGNAYARAGRYQQSIDVYERVLNEDPEHQDAVFNLALVRRAASLAESRDHGAPNGKDDGNRDTQEQPGRLSQQPATRDVIQTVSEEPAEGGAAASVPGTSDQGGPRPRPVTRAGAAGTGDREANVTAETDVASLAVNSSRDAPRDLPDLDRNGQVLRGEIGNRFDEHALADEILLRHIVDDPKVVLRARLRMALERQQRESR